MMNLKQYVERNGPLDYRRAARYVADAAAQLGEWHARDVVHRDLRPAVLILDETGRVKFQLSRLRRFESEPALDPMIDERSVLDVANYLAPEQSLNSYKTDARADIYSLGCTFYFLLTGHPPYAEGSISERLLKHQVAKAPAITDERQNAPAMLVELCERMMSKKREDRPQTATEVASFLSAWLDGQDAA